MLGNEIDDILFTAIRWAAQNGHLKVVKLLLQDPRVDPSPIQKYAIQKIFENDREELNILFKKKRVNPILQEETNNLELSQNPRNKRAKH